MTQGKTVIFIVCAFSSIVAGCGRNELPHDGGLADSGADGSLDAGSADPRDLDVPFITDKQGGALIFHGANVVFGAKGAPYIVNIPRDLVTRLSADWGLNFVRFLVAWAGVEPEAGVYDGAYLDEVEKRLNWFNEEGIRVLLDVHQDVWSEFTCGNGAPKWAVRTDGEPIKCPTAGWFLGYFEPGVKRCFDNFWNYGGPHADLQEHYMAMWAALASRFRSHPAIIAYDIINEPHPGSDFDALEAVGLDSPDSPSPAIDKNKLGPYYQRVIDRIREVDADTWIAFEPRYGAPGNGSPSYLPRLNDPRRGPPRLVYAPHLYSVPMESSLNYDPVKDRCIPNWEKNRAKEVAKLGTPLIAGEWGVGPDWVNSPLFMREVMEAADRLMAGWAYWALDPGGWSWLNSDMTERYTTGIIVRAYPRRIAGIPQNFFYDSATRVLTLTFSDHPAITGATEIYIPARRFYPSGWEVTVSDAGGTWTKEWDAASEILRLTVQKTGSIHSVEVRPAQ
jgi:endoglycosylceramidase